ncbi:MAG: ABC transporter ATP-binding protein [Bacilli bacterium]|nr:ABC transporter ATP-binding protein [Bacilli bacterium]
MISLNKISKHYKNPVVNDFSYTFQNRGLIVVLGSSGSGKSTLLNLISGVDLDYQGEIQLDGTNLRLLNQTEQSSFRLNQTGYVFQDFKLLNLLSVKDNVLFNLDAIASVSKSMKEEMLDRALNYVSLMPKKNVAVKSLSGGEKQRVAIARAIVTEPKYLLCDEPTGNLDDKTAIQIFELLKKYSETHLVIVVSHDQEKSYTYADEIIHLQDGNIQSVEKLHSIDEKKLPNTKIQKKKWPRLSLNLLLRAGVRKMKEKKWRSAFVNLLSSSSLLALGVGVMIATTLRNQIVESFNNIVEENEILVSKRNPSPNPYTYYVSTPEDEVRALYEEYGDYCYDMGVMYLNNFNTFFKTYDRVNLRYMEDFKVPLPSFHSALFVNYVWPEEKTINRFYPDFSGELSLDEVIIGITYSQMVTLCQSLQIQRSFEALGAYLEAKEIMLSLEVANTDWEYEDKQVMRLKAVYNSSVSEVYHTSHYFNQNLFEEKMRFPTTLDINATDLAPFTLKKAFTLHTIEAPTDLIEEMTYNARFNDILLERSENFLKDTCVTTDSCLRNVLLVFTLDKNTVNVSDIIYFKRVANAIKAYYPSTYGGYQMHNSGLLAGFVSNIGFSFDEEKIVTVGDYFAKQTEGEMEDFPGVAIGSMTRFNNHGVLFSSDLSNITQGVAPTNYDEIVLSTGLIDYLGIKTNPIGEKLYYCMYSSTLDAVIIHDFVVTGIVNNPQNYLYHFPLFTISFFRDRLGVSSFNLLPTSLVLTFNEGVNMDLLVSELSAAFKDYQFTSPLVEIGKTVDEVMSYVKTIAFIFIGVTLVVTIMLLSLIAYLNTLENKKDVGLLKHLGHPRETIMQYMLSHTLAMALIATGLAILEMLVLQIFMSGAMASLLGGGTVLNISPLPFIIIVVVGLSLPLLITGIITRLSLH